MNPNEILRIHGTEYKENTKRLLAAAGLAELIDRKNGDAEGFDRAQICIGIKPNLVSPTPASFGATTHPEVVAGIVEYLKEHGFSRILIAEGSWIGDKTSDAYEYCGYRELCETYGVTFVDTQTDGSHTVSCGDLSLNICDVVGKIDFMINVPVLKGHGQTKITCALKNMKGLIPNDEKRRFHAMGLHKPIGYLAKIPQDFIVVDHICGDLQSEDGGNPVETNCIMAARDPVLTDAYVCSLFGLTPQDVPYVGYAHAQGCGSLALEELEVKDLNAPIHNGALPYRDRMLDIRTDVEEAESCSACYAALAPALLRLKEEGVLSRLHTRIAIGQGHEGMQGTVGIGKCTRGYMYSVPGCPPKEDEIYRLLKEWILSGKI